jgi:hypothetical protein
MLKIETRWYLHGKTAIEDRFKDYGFSIRIYYTRWSRLRHGTSRPNQPDRW